MLYSELTLLKEYVIHSMSSYNGTRTFEWFSFEFVEQHPRILDNPVHIPDCVSFTLLVVNSDTGGLSFHHPHRVLRYFPARYGDIDREIGTIVFNAPSEFEYLNKILYPVKLIYRLVINQNFRFVAGILRKN